MGGFSGADYRLNGLTRGSRPVYPALYAGIFMISLSFNLIIMCFKIIIDQQPFATFEYYALKGVNYF